MTLGVRLPNWLGDALLARRALDGLAALDPELHIAAPPPIASLLAADYPRARWIPTGHGLGSAMSLGAAWRAARVDRVVVFPVSLSSRIAAMQSGGRKRIGFGRRPGGMRELAAEWGLTRTVARGVRGSRHLEDEYADLAAASGATLAPPRRLVLPTNASPEVLDALQGAPYLVVAPGARYGPAKRWPAARFAEAARGLAARDSGTRVVVIGEAADAPSCAEVTHLLGDLALDVSGRTDLSSAASIIAGARLFLGNDSGAAHLAAALGRPTIVIFGSTDPRWTAPRAKEARVLWHQVRCAPCFRRTCPWIDGYACMRIIEPRDILAAYDGGVAA